MERSNNSIDWVCQSWQFLMLSGNSCSSAGQGATGSACSGSSSSIRYAVTICAHCLRRLQCDYPMMPYVFSSERKAPLTDDALRKIVGRAGKEAKLPFSVHPHMHAPCLRLQTGTGRTRENRIRLTIARLSGISFRDGQEHEETAVEMFKGIRPKYIGISTYIL